MRIGSGYWLDYAAIAFLVLVGGIGAVVVLTLIT
jgi:hypothetical protein